MRLATFTIGLSLLWGCVGDVTSSEGDIEVGDDELEVSTSHLESLLGVWVTTTPGELRVHGDVIRLDLSLDFYRRQLFDLRWKRCDRSGCGPVEEDGIFRLVRREVDGVVQRTIVLSRWDGTSIRRYRYRTVENVLFLKNPFVLGDWSRLERPLAELAWYTTCGDPVCSGWRDKGLPPCDSAAGGACSSEGASCDPMSACNQVLVCATSDPTLGGSCPISRREHKTDVDYLTPDQRAAYARQILTTPLATWRYRAAPERKHLGFIIDDVEPSMSVDSARDQVDLYGYTSMAVAALQQQADQIATLERQLAELRARVARSEESPACR